MTSAIAALTAAVEQEAKKRPEVRRLMTHPGVGPITALAFVLIIGTPRALSSRQADRQLCRTDSCGRQLGTGHGVK
jgi:transposase